MTTTSRNIANRIIDIVDYNRQKNGNRFYINALILKKLVVICQAFHWKVHRRTLMDEELRYSEYEPCFPSLEKALLFYGDKPVDRAIPDGESVDVFLTDLQKIDVELDQDAENTVRAVTDLFLATKPSCHALSLITRGKSKHWDREYEALLEQSITEYPAQRIVERMQNLHEELSTSPGDRPKGKAAA